MEKELVNRVAESGIITINLEQYYPKNTILEIDIKDYLFQGLILKEKDFRTALKEIDWTQYRDNIVLVFCSTDAIIPVWAYMLLSSYLNPQAAQVFIGTREQFMDGHFAKHIESIDPTIYSEQRVVIKGCSDKPVPPSAYAYITARLQPYAQSIMYGEPCSTVPVFKRPRILNRPTSDCAQP